MSLQSTAATVPIRTPINASSTRYKVNPNWSYRGDNTKYKTKK